MELYYAYEADDRQCRLDAEESGHCIRVLRHRTGDEIHVIDGRGTLYRCRLADDSPKGAVAEVLEAFPHWGAHPYHLTIGCCPTKNNDRFIVLGVYSVSGYTASSYTLDAIDTAMLQAFGNRYINVRKYFAGDGFTDADIKPTAEDSYSISANAVPPSFLVASNSVELNSRAHKLLGKLIFNRMESLGYFDEINQELKLADTTKQILKDDPNYFSRIITNTLK